MVCRLPQSLVSRCLPTYVPVLDDVSAFPRSCLPLSPIETLWWCVRLSRGLVTHCLAVPAFLRSCPICVLVMVYPPEVLSPLVSTYVCLCWMVCPPSRGLVSPCVPFCFALVDGVSTSPPCLPLSSISPHVPVLACPRSQGLVSPFLPFSPHACLCWMVCPPSRGLASHCLAVSRPCLPLSSNIAPFALKKGLNRKPLLIVIYLVIKPCSSVSKF